MGRTPRGRVLHLIWAWAKTTLSDGRVEVLLFRRVTYCSSGIFTTPRSGGRPGPPRRAAHGQSARHDQHHRQPQPRQHVTEPRHRQRPAGQHRRRRGRGTAPDRANDDAGERLAVGVNVRESESVVTLTLPSGCAVATGASAAAAPATDAVAAASRCPSCRRALAMASDWAAVGVTPASVATRPSTSLTCASLRTGRPWSSTMTASARTGSRRSPGL